MCGFADENQSAVVMNPVFQITMLSDGDTDCFAGELGNS